MRLGMGLRISDFLRAGAAAVVKSTLVNNLVSYWPLNEQSGTRVDVVGANDLTDNNTVGAVLRGPEGTVAKLVGASSESLTRANTDFGSESFTLSFWYNVAGIAGIYQNLVIKGSQLDILSDLYDTTKHFRWGVWDGAGFSLASRPSSPDGWVHFVGWYDAATKVASFCLNNDTPTNGAANNGHIVAANNFEVGTAGGGNNLTGNMSAVSVWGRVLTANERTALFAKGNGLRYADLPADLKTGLVSWWNLDEVSGVRYDSHGSNHLTDNNTVGSVINAGDAMDGAAASFVAANTESLSHATATFPTSEADFSVSMWIKPTAASGAHTIINSGTGSGANEWLLSHGADFTLTVDGDSDTAGTCTTDWQHVVLTYVTATKVMTLYVDTVSVVSGTGTGTGAYKAANDLFLGVQGDGTTEPYGGQIDEVAFWSRALSTAEIADLYAAGAGFFYNTTTEDFE